MCLRHIWQTWKKITKNPTKKTESWENPNKFQKIDKKNPTPSIVGGRITTPPPFPPVPPASYVPNTTHESKHTEIERNLISVCFFPAFWKKANHKTKQYGDQEKWFTNFVSNYIDNIRKTNEIDGQSVTQLLTFKNAIYRTIYKCL